ncbi:hypothetical protein [Clavibacter capsici]|uniref:hypothetical protein n=1 Tax=Clavibacter capsici TaxID=1874630 RepID=UPI0014283FA1|nr:hypothetical protein [Clavibacter capsici]QIS38636.1 hypothetical protein GW572_04485 [Clavibacter capsici]
MNWSVFLVLLGWGGGLCGLAFALIAFVGGLLGESVRLFALSFVAALIGIALLAMGIAAS